jgi:SAM-dependent methyltransferase
MSGKAMKKCKTLASRADRHQLYEESVQDAKQECKFVRQSFRALRGRPARILREDFCGTAAVCCQWVKRNKGNIAIGVDLDPDVLDWARQHNLAALKPDRRERVRLVQEDVTARPTDEPVDVVLAMNFSYQVFKTRDRLRDYFTSVHASLADDGVFFLDAFGGYEAYKEIREVTKYKRFHYIWEHARYNPISGEILCHIHFRFPDGSKIKKAFSYDWRLWTLPELQEVLTEAGFARVRVYWEEVDAESGEGLGSYAPSESGDADPGWVCFVVAEK